MGVIFRNRFKTVKERENNFDEKTAFYPEKRSLFVVYMVRGFYAKNPKNRTLKFPNQILKSSKIKTHN